MCRSTPPAMPAAPGASAACSARSTDVELDHLLSVRPIMRLAIPPAQRMPDALPPQRIRELGIAGIDGVIAANRQDDIQPAQLPRRHIFLQPRDERQRLVKISVVSVIVAEPATHVLYPRTRDDAPHPSRMAQAE